MVPYSGWMYWTRLARIARSILVIRGRKVLLDTDLAALYGVPTKALVQAVKRNPERFPDDFLFPLDSVQLHPPRPHPPPSPTPPPRPPPPHPSTAPPPPTPPPAPTPPP